MEEIWKDIKGYEGYYQVSNTGKVKRLEGYVKHWRGGLQRKKEKILSNSKDKDGYLIIGLCKNGKSKVFKVHRLVAETFIPNPDNLPQVNHKDENKSNNCVDNLEWCSPEYNVNYGSGIKKRSKQRINCKVLSKPIIQYNLEGKIINYWPSEREINRKLGYKPCCISACCVGRTKTSYGYIWKYK